MAAAIQQGLTDRSCADRVELGNLVSSKHALGAQYVVDWSSMKQINVASGFTRDVKVVKAPAAVVPQLFYPPVDASDDLARIREGVRACEESLLNVMKAMAKRLEADLLALRLQASKIAANRVPAKVICPPQVAPLSRDQPADYSESFYSAGSINYYDSLSDDDY